MSTTDKLLIQSRIDKHILRKKELIARKKSVQVRNEIAFLERTINRLKGWLQEMN